MRQLSGILRAVAATTAVALAFTGVARLSHASESVAAPALTGRKLTMMSPKYAGFTRDGRHYEVTAASAVQIEGADGMEFVQPRARLDMANGTTFDVSAAMGRFSRDMDSLVMRNDVVLAAGPGRDIRLGEVTVDLRNNRLISDMPFEITLKTGTIRGDRLEVAETGAIVVVHGSVIQAGNVVYFERYSIP
jgi:LPS export ABC transporter protein LptC